MPILELSEAQVVELVKQLPPDQQRGALLALAEGAARTRDERMQLAETQLRRIAAERGLDWEKMPENDRERLVDELVHEDRPCGK
jgi:hypothetical protein